MTTDKEEKITQEDFFVSPSGDLVDVFQHHGDRADFAADLEDYLSRHVGGTFKVVMEEEKWN